MAAVALDAPLAVVRPARKWRRIAVMLAVAAIGIGSVVLYKQVRAPTDALSAGLSAHAAGHLTEATKDYQQVLASSPNNKFAHYNLGLIDQVSGRLASAASHYEVALRTDPNYAPAIFNLATVATAQGSAKRAAALYRRLLVIEPANAVAHLNLGFALRAQGLTEAGDSELDRAVALDPRLASRRTPPKVRDGG